MQQKHKTKDGPNVITEMMEATMIMKDNLCFAHPMIKTLIKALYKDICPASAIAPTIIWPHLDSIINENEITESVILPFQLYAPILANFVILGSSLDRVIFI